MNKLNWYDLEQLSIKKYEKYGGENWLDIVMMCAGKKVEAERKLHPTDIIET